LRVDATPEVHRFVPSDTDKPTYIKDWTMPKKETEPSKNLPVSIREDLLAAQAESIENVTLPRVKIMGAAACLYEFGDTNDTERSFTGVILNYHPRNVMWDKPYGEERAEGEDSSPACSSVNNVVGHPRRGFEHKMLEETANGTESINCKECKYAQWGSKRLISEKGNAKGKACTNQRSLYIMMDDRATPVELTLPPTSLAGYDEYLMSLVNKTLPVQSVVTKFSQEKKEKKGLEWAQATFEMVAELDGEQFTKIMELREQFSAVIAPEDVVPVLSEEGKDSDLPF